MALIKQRKLDKIEVVGDFKQIQLRHDDQIVDDETGKVESKGNFHRHVLSPGEDISGESSEIQAIAAIVWTQDIIDAYAAHLDEALQPGAGGI